MSVRDGALERARWNVEHLDARIQNDVQLLAVHDKIVYKISRANPRVRLQRRRPDLDALVLNNSVPSSALLKEIFKSPPVCNWRLAFWEAEFWPNVKFP